MTLWLDAQLPPSLAVWFSEQFGVTAYSMKHLGLDQATDFDIFQRAKADGVVLLSSRQFDERILA